MKSNTEQSLILSLMLMVGYLTSVFAVTDAGLDSLEKQIEQQEAEEKKKAELEKQRIEAARRTELERQRKAEEAKKRTEEEKKEKINLLLSKGRDLALIKEGAQYSIPIGEGGISSKNTAIDNIINNYGLFHGYVECPGSNMIVILKETSLVNIIRFILWDRDNRYFKCRLEVYGDPQNQEILSDKNSGKWKSWQEDVFEPK